jgi:hypothetical protein
MSAIQAIRLLVLAALLATPAAGAGDTKGNAANGKDPGTAMAGIPTDPRQRADVIAFLATLKN